jgi:hypothetical protein
MKTNVSFKTQFISIIAFLTVVGTPSINYGHCDTMDGPVVKDAKLALEQADATPVLKWINAGHEQEILNAFDKTLAVRNLNKEARELADMYFFETLVRVHRAGEGAPYTGLKPAGAVEPIIAASDKALDTGSIGDLVQEVNQLVAKGIRTRFDKALEKRKLANESVKAGREFVEVYVQFVHYVERLHNDALGHAEGHGGNQEHGQSAESPHTHSIKVHTDERSAAIENSGIDEPAYRADSAWICKLGESQLRETHAPCPQFGFSNLSNKVSNEVTVGQ